MGMSVCYTLTKVLVKFDKNNLFMQIEQIIQLEQISQPPFWRISTGNDHVQSNLQFKT